MTYNFKDILQNKEFIYNEFISNYTVNIDINNQTKAQKIEQYYRAIFEQLNNGFESETLLHEFEELTKYKISLEIPYGVFINEVYSLQCIVVSSAIEQNKSADIGTILQLFKEVTNSVASLYLREILDKLICANNIRRSSLADVIEKNLVIHYEAHLIWLTDLAEHIKTQGKTDFPELEHTLCIFGKWLHSDGKKVVQNNSKYKAIYTIHEKLHQFAQKIYQMLDSNTNHLLVIYLEKCELISLALGTELALLDQVLINKKVTKDTLTGSLNRNSLKDLFESQYELALATNNHFVLAMCDLDHFKHVNDTYGHVAGDRVLKLFVDTVKKNIRNSDMIIRYGGEEFVIILPTLDKKAGYEILDNIRQEFEDSQLEYDGNTIKATVSMGMMKVSPEQLFRQSFIDEYIMIVDKNLYIAKEAGRNRVEVY